MQSVALRPREARRKSPPALRTLVLNADYRPLWTYPLTIIAAQDAVSADQAALFNSGLTRYVDLLDGRVSGRPRSSERQLTRSSLQGAGPARNAALPPAPALAFLALAGRGGRRLGNDLLLPFSPAGQRQQQCSLASIGRAPAALGRGPCTWLFASPFPSKAAFQDGHQIDYRRRCADCSRFDGQPLHLRLDQLSQGLLVAVSVGARIKTPGPLRDDRLGDGDHLGIGLTSGCELRRRTSSAARKVNSATPAPRGSTMTIRSRRLRVSRPIPTTPASAIAAPITGALDRNRTIGIEVVSGVSSKYIGSWSVTGAGCCAAAAGPATASPGTPSTKSKNGHRC